MRTKVTKNVLMLLAFVYLSMPAYVFTKNPHFFPIPFAYWK